MQQFSLLFYNPPLTWQHLTINKNALLLLSFALMFQTFYDVLTNVAADAVKKTIKFILLLAKN